MNSSLGVGMNAIQKILHGYLGVRKLCARWIPHKLTEEQKHARVSWCVQIQQRFNFGHSKASQQVMKHGFTVTNQKAKVSLPSGSSKKKKNQQS